MVLWPWAVRPRAGATSPGTATRFQGVTLDAVRSSGGLYEVTTTSGVPVRLHDMSFLDLTYAPTSPPSLVLRFAYDDPAWTPVEAARTPVAVFTFGGVLVLQHEDEPTTPDTPAEWLREVQVLRLRRGARNLCLVHAHHLSDVHLP